MNKSWLAVPVVLLVGYLGYLWVKRGSGGGGGGGGGTVTVTVRASNYGSEAKFWAAMPKSIPTMMPVPITQEIVWQNIPADDITVPSGYFVVDMYVDHVAQWMVAG
jgi:hypothetical protein